MMLSVEKNLFYYFFLLSLPSVSYLKICDPINSSVSTPRWRELVPYMVRNNDRIHWDILWVMVLYTGETQSLYILPFY